MFCVIAGIMSAMRHGRKILLAGVVMVVVAFLLWLRQPGDSAALQKARQIRVGDSRTSVRDLLICSRIDMGVETMDYFVVRMTDERHWTWKYPFLHSNPRVDRAIQVEYDAALTVIAVSYHDGETWKYLAIATSLPSASQQAYPPDE